MIPMLAPAAFAATPQVTWSEKNIEFASYTVHNVSAYAESGTTYMPVWYVLQGLKQSGYSYTFDGKVLNITAPAGVTPDTTGLTVGSGNLSIEINGQLVKKVETEVRRDGGNGNLTQFIPIYYIQQILSALSFYNQWDGTTWTGEPITASLNGNAAVGQGELDAFALTLTDPNGQMVVPNGTVTWSVSGSGQATIDQSTGIFTANSPGTYEVTASVDGFHVTQQVEVYGAPAGVKLSDTNSSLVADGAATKTITVQAVDAAGNVVQNFTGQVTVIVPSTGGMLAGGVTSGDNNEAVVSLYDGVGTVTLTAPSTVPDSVETISSSNLTSLTDTLPASLSYGSLGVSYVAPVVAAIQITPDAGNIATDVNNVMNLDVSLVDAAGNPLGSSVTTSVFVTFTLTGPASFAPGLTVTTWSQYVDPNNPATIPLYGVAGQQGPVTVSASGGGASGTASFTIS